MRSFNDSRRGGDAFFDRGSALAAAALFCILLTGCTGGEPVALDSVAPASISSPVPTPTGTPTDDPADGGAAAPLPTVSAPLDEPIELDTGVVLAVSAVRVITVEAATPGEVSGPAIAVTVTARNDSDAASSVDSAVVSVTTDDGALGIPTTAGPGSPLTGELAPGASAEGTYVFMLDPAADRGVTVIVSHAAGEPVALFTGRTS